jgi:hypothetical protein
MHNPTYRAVRDSAIVEETEHKHRKDRFVLVVCYCCVIAWDDVVKTVVERMSA